MSRLLLVVVLVALASASLLMVEGRHHRNQHHSAAHSPLTSDAPKKEYNPERVQLEHPGLHSKPRSAGERLDWHSSVFQGVDRALEVDADAETQVRLAFIPGGMSVSYAVTNQQSTPSTVWYGLSPGSMSKQAQAGEESTYGTLWFYTALLPNLPASTRHYFQFGDGTTVYSFVTAHAVGDATPFTVLVVGDMGLYNSENTMAQMRSHLNSTDFYHHIGDLSYADDFYLRTNDTYEGSWNKWQDLMEPITSVAAYMSLPGNHEVTCDEVTPFLCPDYQKNFTAYRNRFRMPWRETGGVDNLWYSYDYGLVHFVQIDTETDYPDAPMGPGTYYGAGPFGDQLAWLEADLAKAVSRRSITPWIVVSGHRPLYSSGHEEKHAIAAFESLFVKYDIDLYFAGHVHSYERTYPLTTGGVVTQKDYNNPPGYVCIVNGAAGNVEGLSTGATPAPYSALMDESDFGYGTMSISNGTHMRWQYFRSTDASEVDDIWYIKTH